MWTDTQTDFFHLTSQAGLPRTNVLVSDDGDDWIAPVSEDDGVCWMKVEALRWSGGPAAHPRSGVSLLAVDRAALTRQIREANDIVAVIGGYLSVQPTGNPHLFKALCPFHNDHRPSLQIDSKWQNFRCWACGKFGDVFTFVMEHEKVSFVEARALLARRANIPLEENDAEQMTRVRQLEAIRWASEQYRECLLDSPLAEAARKYLGERKILGETVRRFGLGYAPASGDWLMQRLHQCSVPLDTFEDVGLIGKRQNGTGYYDRFRDRVMFPVRNSNGQTVGFGGRVLPGSPLAERGPKYYNSAETPLFSKSELLYGLDQARQSAASAGYLAVVEGYTDVLMAHQMGVTNVVATMGTALNTRHVMQLRRVVPKVVLVFDADAGGETGVDRALAIFASHNIELAIAQLPAGLDPCDLLVQQGAEAFRQVLTSAADALDFKLNQLLEREAGNGVEGQRRVIDSLLNVIAQTPEAADRSIQMKRELMVTKIAHRLGVRETTLWARLKELRQSQRDSAAVNGEAHGSESKRAAPAPHHEVELIQLMLARPEQVAAAMEKIQPRDLTHPGLRQLLAELYDLQRAGATPDLDALRPRIENPLLVAKALEWMDIGRKVTTPPDEWLANIIRRFRERREKIEREQLQSQLSSATSPEEAAEILRRWQHRTDGDDR